MKIAYGVPVFITNDLHMEFTEKTLESVKSKEHDVETIVAINHCDSQYHDRVVKLGFHTISTKENAVTIAWNAIIKYATDIMKADYIIVSNNDIILHPEAIDNLVKFAEEHPEFILWTGNEYGNLRGIKTASVDNVSFDDHPHFSFWMIKPEFVEKMKAKEEGTGEPFPGYFDENIKPAYFEDGDMHNRILRNGFKAGKTATSMFYHFGSRTIKTDPLLDRKNGDTYDAIRKYFKKKWGWDQHGTSVENDDPIRYAARRPFEKPVEPKTTETD